MEVYGYCRCSTDDTKQDISRQIRELKLLGVTKRENIYQEYESGSKINRVELNKLLTLVEERNEPCVLVATEVSRLTRSTKQLCDLIDFAKLHKIKLVLGNFVVDCSLEILDPMTEGMLKMMGVFAEIERNLTSARVKSGLANARAKGVELGRKKKTISDIPKNVTKLYDIYSNGAMTKTEYAKACGISRPTLDKYLDLLKNGK